MCKGAEVGNFIRWDLILSGKMISKVDKKGRVLLPKRLREAVGLKEGSIVRVRAEENKIIIEKVGSVADRFFGKFKVERWPEDLDEFLKDKIREFVER